MSGWPRDARDLERLRARDPEAQGRFFSFHRRTVVAVCQRILGSHTLAEDVAEDVLIDFLFDAVGRVERIETIPAYLSLMAARRALRYRDRVRRVDPLPVDAVDPRVDDPAMGLAIARMTPRLRECLERLTPKARSVIKLRFDADLTQEHIGRMLGGTKQYIGKVIRQSLATLRVCLERRGIPSIGEQT